MKSRKALTRMTDYIWKIPICAVVYADGLVMSRIIFLSLGLVLPRMPEQADESVAGFDLLAGSIILATGLAPLTGRLQGAYWLCLLILFAFMFVHFGVSNPIEDSILSTIYKE